jgi:SAM-dependent methyltransferase
MSRQSDLTANGTAANPPVGADTVCPVCRTKGRLLRTCVDLAGGTIYRCAECAGYSLHPPMHVEYDNSGWSRNRQAGWERDVSLGREMAPAIRDYAARRLGRPIQSVLEIGCGSAFMGIGFRETGCTYTGTEIDVASIEFARSHGLDVHQASAEGLNESDIASGKFDLILSSNVFEHLDDPPRAFANVAALAGGLVIIIVPNAHGLFARSKALTPLRRLIAAYNRTTRVLAYSIDGYWHNIAYTRMTLRRLAGRASLRVQEIRGMSINHRPLGFVQRNNDPVFVAVDAVATRLGMASQLLLIAQPNERRT